MSTLVSQTRPFAFVDPGPLVDGDLELVAPSAETIDDVLAICRHPLTVRDMPNESSITRQTLEQFLKLAPGGRQAGSPEQGWLPTYHFWMMLRDHSARDGVVKHVAGGMGLRVGTTPDIELFTGNIGYHVYPPHRGQGLAERACRLVLPLARRHGMRQLWITCNPNNIASRRTCERLGADLAEIIPVPIDHAFYGRGERFKCRYLIQLHDPAEVRCSQST